MTRILLLRHAPTAWNREGRIQGRTDVPLSPEGEAIAAGWRLPGEARDFEIRSSPLRRAIATAEAMGRAAVPFGPLVEMDWGTLEGRRLAAIRAEGGQAFAEEEARGLDFRPGGGETPREVGLRALAGLQTLSRETVGVTHKGVLRALFARTLGWDMRSTSPVRIADDACHLFVIDPAGALRLERPNIPLCPPLCPSPEPP